MVGAHVRRGTAVETLLEKVRRRISSGSGCEWQDRSVTLTLAYIDRQCMVQVADRRISQQDASGANRTKHDQAIKIRMPRGSLLVSYSGVAEFAEGDTGDLLENHFNQTNLDIEAAVNKIAEIFTKRFERTRFRKHQLIVTITGWVLRPDDSLVPVVGTITNREPTSGARLTEFVGIAKELPYSGGWVPTGGPLSDEMRDTLNKWIVKALRRRPSPAVIVSVFLHAIRKEAEKNPLIGKNAYAVVYPLAAAEYAATNQVGIEVVRSFGGEILENSVTETFIPEGVERAILIRRDSIDLGRATITWLDEVPNELPERG